MNEYLTNLNKIEFVVTDACTGRCKHCSQGEHSARGAKIDGEIAADAVRRIAAEYNITTVMVFGGEPLLHLSAVFAIMNAATKLNIKRRQLITNGFFATDKKVIRETVAGLFASGVNEILLSVDAFHQETIPLDTVMSFTKEVVAYGIPMRLSPAWLVSREDENLYNEKTRKILAEFSEMKIPVGDGNVVFSEGNAIKYLNEYFTESLPENPYIEDPCQIKCVSFAANGDVLGENVYKKDVGEILSGYMPR